MSENENLKKQVQYEWGANDDKDALVNKLWTNLTALKEFEEENVKLRNEMKDKVTLLDKAMQAQNWL